MEILKLNVIGYYSYCPDINIENYNNNNNNNKECIICKRDIYDPSYEVITNNKNIVNDTDILIGKCGHTFHKDCISSWLINNNTCPIDKIVWNTYRTIDSTTKLVLNNKDKSFKKYKNKLLTENKSQTNTLGNTYVNSNFGSTYVNSNFGSTGITNSNFVSTGNTYVNNNLNDDDLSDDSSKDLSEN